MIRKVTTSTIIGLILGMLITAYFIGSNKPLIDYFWCKITASAIITGFLIGLYDYFSKSRFQVFYMSIVIGILVFYVKYWITNHHYDPGIMGAFTGAVLGGVLATLSVLKQNLKASKRIEGLMKKGFGRYAN